jgi:hypothetical protein
MTCSKATLCTNADTFQSSGKRDRKSSIEKRRKVMHVKFGDRLCGLVEFLATDPEARVRFPALQKKRVMGPERGPLSLVSTTDELLDRKVATPV